MPLNAESPILLSAVNDRGRGLQVGFHRCGDRFVHTIAAVEGTRLLPLLASVEGTEADDWPECPPLQEVRVEQQEETGRVILAVGRAGRSHWSLSVHAETALDSTESEMTRASLLFDVAVRLRDEPQQLGSMYRSMTAAGPADESSALELMLSGQRYLIEAVADDGPAARLEPTPAGLLIAASSLDGALPRTVRWQYRVRATH